MAPDPNYIEIILQFTAATVLGGLIGFERKLSGKDPSLKTFSLICLGSCLFTIASTLAAAEAQMADPGRVAAQIASGIGFLGAGAIFKPDANKVSGLTTAAYMWFTAAVGLIIGLNQIMIGVIAVLFSLMMIVLG